MRREIFQEIEIPQGVEAEVEGNMIVIKGKHGENRKKFNMRKLKIGKKDNRIFIGSKVATKKEKRLINTIAAHLKNMIKGIEKGFEYKLKIVYSHFPITVELHEKEAVIKNFLGEKIPRKSKILSNVDVKIDKDYIKVFSSNRESAGQTAANFEKATWIRLKDRRVFQDGIFIINKAGKEI
ncbi:50S ribosomal protein L6 [Candidatus Pacearchaeota archaeon]|nr:50S ribosomal protein L6 [Candidatus Pacearchaeota archaeon]